MEILQQKEKLEVLIHSIGLSKLYADVPQAFHLAHFKKGELLTGPGIPLEDLLFLAKGSVHIYGLRENGSSFSVYLADQRTILGDFEFLQHTALPFYTEAAEDVLCILLDARHYRRDLEQNIDFLHFLLVSLSSKFRLIFLIGNSSQPVEEKLLIFLRELQSDHTIHSIHSVTQKLQCSRSQLQRVVRDLCKNGMLEHIGKGKYRLTPQGMTAQ